MAIGVALQGSLRCLSFTLTVISLLLFAATVVLCSWVFILYKESITLPQALRPECFYDVSDYLRHFREQVDPAVPYFIEEGAGISLTRDLNEKAFNHFRLVPRFIYDGNQSAFTPASVVLGNQKLRIPIGISPMAGKTWVHGKGDLEAAMAAQNTGAVFINSFLTEVSMETVIKAAPNGTNWQQIYPWADRKYLLAAIRRAEDAGFQALVVTMDQPVVMLSRHQEAVWLTLPQVTFGNHNISLEVSPARMPQDPTWDTVTWIRSNARLPVILEGIISARVVTSREFKESQIAGIIVSNHGGRSLDGLPATVDALSAIARAARGAGVEVYMDGGVRRGTDVYKALTLGARLVFLGRPVLYGLSRDGRTGVEHILDILTKELNQTARMCGSSSLDDLDPEVVVKAEDALCST